MENVHAWPWLMAPACQGRFFLLFTNPTDCLSLRPPVWLVTDKDGTLSRIDPVANTVRQKISIATGSYNPAFSDGVVWVTGVESSVLTAVDINWQGSGICASGVEASFFDRRGWLRLDAEPRTLSDSGTALQT